MKYLIFTALLALSIASCTSKESDAITNPVEITGKAEGVLIFTYNGVQETVYNAAIFNENGFAIPGINYPDLTKPWFAFSQDTNKYRIYLGMGRDMQTKLTVQKRLFVLYAKKPNSNSTDTFDYYIYDTAVQLTNKNVTITSVDGKYISGTFSSDKITGKFQNIRYNTLF